MSRNVLVITTSLRANSNSDRLAEAFVNGARDAGNNVETVSLKGKTIAFCKGCFACSKLGHCCCMGNTYLLLRDEWSDEDDDRPCKFTLSKRL